MPSPTQEAPAEASAGAAPNRFAGPLRFSLRSLIIGVTITAVACMAFRYANPLWASVFLTTQLCLTIAAVILAIYGDLRHRAWRVGFVITATILGLYCWLHGVQRYRYFDTYFAEVIPAPLAFRYVTEWGYDVFYGDDRTTARHNPKIPKTFYLPIVQTGPSQDLRLTNVQTIADPLWVLSIASIGGCFAAWLDARRRELPQTN